jgi:hypothetical protein
MVSEQAETSRREANTLRLENTQLRHEVGRLGGEIGRLGGFQPPGDLQRSNGAPHKGAELPPIRGAFMSEDSMTGVQYNEPAMHLAPQHRPKPPPERRGPSFSYNETARANGGPIYPEASSFKSFQPQAQVNGFQHSEQPRSNGF